MEFIRVNKLFRVIASDIFAARGKVSWIDERIGIYFFSVIFIHRIIEVKKQYYIESYRRYFKTNSYSENWKINFASEIIRVWQLLNLKNSRFFGRFVSFYLHIEISLRFIPFFFFISFILSKIVIFDNQTFIASFRGREESHAQMYTFLHLLINDAILLSPPLPWKP